MLIACAFCNRLFNDETRSRRCPHEILAPVDQLAYFRRLEEHGRVNVFRRLGRWVRWKLTGADFCPQCETETDWRREVLYDFAHVYDVPHCPDAYRVVPVPYGSACICNRCDVAVMHIPDVGLTVLPSCEIVR
jgi:hypothetical protein